MDPQTVDTITKQYPYPIACLYRIIAGMDLHEDPDTALDYILEAAEAVARLLGAIALTELLALLETRAIDIPPGIRNEFKKNLKRPSFGIWLGLAREGLTCLKDVGAEVAIPDLLTLSYTNDQTTEFRTAIERLCKLRNGRAHGKVNLGTQAEKRSAVRVSLNYLHSVLARLEFLAGVSFGYIQTIVVDKKRRQCPAFHHKGKMLNGDRLGKGISLNSVQAEFKETDTVIIRYDASHYLNLYPFYLYEESAGDAVDVFYYNGLEGKRLEYLGIDPGGKFLVENSPPPPDMDCEEEYDLLISGGKGSKRAVNIKHCPGLYDEFDHIFAQLG